MTDTFLYIPPRLVEGFAYPEVNTYADLPAAASKAFEIYVVLTTTGIWPFRKSQGLWYSDGASWNYLSDFTPSYIRDLYESNSDVNRFSDAYKDKVDASAAGQILIPFGCQNTDVVGDLVILQTDDVVQKTSNNTYAGLVLGIINDKPTATTCNIQVSGSRSGYAGFTRGLPVFVSPTGTPTTTQPASNSIQTIGIATSGVRFIMDVAKTKVIL